MIGYRAWFYYAEKKSDAFMEARLDRNQYDEKDLVTLTIPLDNPYQQEQKSFQRATGEISFEGKAYQLVKRKVTDGNLVLLCLSDNHKMVLKKAKSELGNSSTDLASGGKSGSRNNLSKNFNGSDYTEHHFNLNSIRMASASKLSQNTFHVCRLSDAYVTNPGKPPRFRA
jgi:hypothetical protein